MLIIVKFILCLNKNYHLREKNYRILLAQIIQSQLTQNFNNYLARYIYFNFDIMLQIKMI